jgi:hypothetical protein
MAEVVVGAPVLWTKHIHGEPGLVQRLQALSAGETIELAVAGHRGVWRKMEDGRDGRPTPGLRPVGSAEAFWRGLRDRRKGEVVPLSAAEPAKGKLVRSDADRLRAGVSLLTASGQASDGHPLSPDELNERW